MKVPLLDLKREYQYMKAGIDAAVAKCLDHQQWILGPEVKQLEDEVAQYLSVKHCIGISSGTDALVLALRALAIQRYGKQYFTREDKIITTPFTFTATGDAILRAGATPVFVDIDPLTYNIHSDSIKECLHRVKGIVGIIPVHLYGQACAMDHIMRLAKDHNLFVVEDVAQAFGGSCKGSKLGTMGDAGAFSFFPSKNLGGFGDGGLVSTNNADLAETVRMLIKHGGKDKYNVDHIGYNARLDTLQAAVLLAKLKYIDEFNTKRRIIAGLYDTHLRGVRRIKLPQLEPEHVFHQYTIAIGEGQRDEFQKRLKDDGVDSMVYYPVPLHKMKVFDKRCVVADSLSHSEMAVREVLSLPIEPLLSHDEVLFVCDRIKNILNR